MRDIPNRTTREMRSTLEELFENPFEPGSKYWRAHQVLLRKAADALMSISSRTNREIDRARTIGIIIQLEKDLRKIGPSQQEAEAA
jgi:hypothetical protein